MEDVHFVRNTATSEDVDAGLLINVQLNLVLHFGMRRLPRCSAIKSQGMSSLSNVNLCYEEVEETRDSSNENFSVMGPELRTWFKCRSAFMNSLKKMCKAQMTTCGNSQNSFRRNRERQVQ